MEITMPISRFVALRHRLQALTSMRDIQIAGALLHWSLKCGFTVEELIQFTMIAPQFSELEKYGFFAGVTLPVPNELRLKEILARLPKHIRAELRRSRLNNMNFERLNSRSGKGG